MYKMSCVSIRSAFTTLAIVSMAAASAAPPGGDGLFSGMPGVAAPPADASPQLYGDTGLTGTPLHADMRFSLDETRAMTDFLIDHQTMDVERLDTVLRKLPMIRDVSGLVDIAASRLPAGSAQAKALVALKMRCASVDKQILANPSAFETLDDVQTHGKEIAVMMVRARDSASRSNDTVALLALARKLDHDGAGREIAGLIKLYEDTERRLYETVGDPRENKLLVYATVDTLEFRSVDEYRSHERARLAYDKAESERLAKENVTLAERERQAHRDAMRDAWNQPSAGRDFCTKEQNGDDQGYCRH